MEQRKHRRIFYLLNEDDRQLVEDTLADLEELVSSTPMPRPPFLKYAIAAIYIAFCGAASVFTSIYTHSIVGIIVFGVLAYLSRYIDYFEEKTPYSLVVEDIILSESIEFKLTEEQKVADLAASLMLSCINVMRYPEGGTLRESDSSCETGKEIYQKFILYFPECKNKKLKRILRYYVPWYKLRRKY